MSLTAAQLHWLGWLDKQGGRATIKGSRIIANSEQTNTSAALPFLHLVIKGYVEAFCGQLCITNKGRDMVNPFRRPAEKGGVP